MARFARRLQRSVTPDVSDGFVLGVTEPKLGDGSVGVRSGVTLTQYNGNFLFTANNQVVRNLDISGYVHFQGYTACLLENCIIRGGPASAYGTTNALLRFYDSGGRVSTNNTARFCELNPSDPSVDIYGVVGWGWTVERCSIINVVDGVNMHQSTTSGSTVKGGKLRGCYVQNSWYATDPRQTDGSHNDGIQVFAGDANEAIGNSFVNPDRKGSGIVLTPQAVGAISDMKINYNWFRGAYTQLSAWQNNGTIDTPGLEIIGNRHGLNRGSSGDHQWDILITQANYDASVEISGNVVMPGGGPANININN